MYQVQQSKTICTQEDWSPRLSQTIILILHTTTKTRVGLVLLEYVLMLLVTTRLISHAYIHVASKFSVSSRTGGSSPHRYQYKQIVLSGRKVFARNVKRRASNSVMSGDRYFSLARSASINTRYGKSINSSYWYCTSANQQIEPNQVLVGSSRGGTGRTLNQVLSWSTAIVHQVRYDVRQQVCMLQNVHQQV